MAAYYNEIDKYAAQWLRNLIAKGLIADGVVRGLLCTNCNRMIGHAHDDASRLIKAASYLSSLRSQRNSSKHIWREKTNDPR
jgi:hypothetical protein